MQRRLSSISFKVREISPDYTLACTPFKYSQGSRFSMFFVLFEYGDRTLDVKRIVDLPLPRSATRGAFTMMSPIPV